MANTVQEWERTVRGGADAIDRISADIVRVPIVFVNTYLVDAPDGSWVLVDTGLPKSAGRIRAAAEARYGPGSRPSGIVLTHGHFDHAGSARELASQWDVPIYAHTLELPYLTGLSDYPPADPTIGGAISFLSRFFPSSGYDFGDRVRPLPGDGTIPGMPGWKWVHTPGHTAGHISLFREADRFLIAGDAFTTMDLDSWAAQVTREPCLDRPPAPMTSDWLAAQVSVGVLAELGPHHVAAGHGLPVSDPDIEARLRFFATHFPVPEKGRYVAEPARTNERGVASLPPTIPDPLRRQAIAGLLLLLAIRAMRSADRDD